MWPTGIITIRCLFKCSDLEKMRNQKKIKRRIEDEMQLAKNALDIQANRQKL
jgi:hypothetical protein